MKCSLSVGQQGDIGTGAEALRAWQARGGALTPVSQRFLGQRTSDQAATLAHFVPGQLQHAAGVTALASVYKNIQERGAVEWLVAGTEGQTVLVINSGNFAIAASCTLPRYLCLSC